MEGGFYRSYRKNAYLLEDFSVLGFEEKCVLTYKNRNHIYFPHK